MMRTLLKKTVTMLVHGARRSRVGRFAYQQMLEAMFREQSTVAHHGVTMTFVVPNWIAKYRADTFATKEPETLEWIATIPAGGVLWDIGANVGMYSVYAATARRCRVFAFEPSVFNLELLARNLFLNGLQKAVTIIPVPLSDGPGVSHFSMSTTSWAGALSTFAHGVNQNGEMMQPVFEYSLVGLSMDQARDRLDLPQPSHLKIDVDGIEHLILQGGPSVLAGVESVLVEINDLFADQGAGAVRHLEAAGLRLFRKVDAGAPGVFNQWWRRER